MFSLTILAILSIAYLIYLLYHYILYPTLLSPLSPIPNAHFTSPISARWIQRIRRTGTEIRTVYALHARLGPIVRLAPDELSVNSLGGLRTIYTGGFEKHPWYRAAFLNFGRDNLVSTRAYGAHSARKRILSHVYAKSHLQNSRDWKCIAHEVVQRRFLPALHRLARSGQVVNVLPLMQGVGMDFTSAYLFGLRNGTGFVVDSAARDTWLRSYERFKAQTPQERSMGDVERWCLALCERAEACMCIKTNDDDPDPDPDTDTTGTSPVVYRQLSHGLAKSIADPRERLLTVASEMLDHLVAGHETSGITFTYIIWEMSRRPQLQARLREEASALSPPIVYSEDDEEEEGGGRKRRLPLLPSAHAVDSLPLLHAIVHETLRLHAAVPGLQPRMTPDSPRGTTLEGYANIPGGVTVSSSAYTLHRNTEVFPEPWSWLPERWLSPGGGDGDMRRMFWAFGSGGRMCLGSNFALQEIKLVTAAIYSNFTTVIVDDEGIEQVDEYIAPPKSQKLMIEFRRV